MVIPSEIPQIILIPWYLYTIAARIIDTFDV